MQKKLKRVKAQIAVQEKANEQKIAEYKKRMEGYDGLVNKLYGLAE